MAINDNMNSSCTAPQTGFKRHEDRFSFAVFKLSFQATEDQNYLKKLNEIDIYFNCWALIGESVTYIRSVLVVAG